MTIEIRHVDYNSAFPDLKYVRETVFVKEQGVPLELEWDEQDPKAYHLLAFDKKQPVATARLLSSGKIGRMAVLEPWRRQGIGSALVIKLIDVAKSRGLAEVGLSAQVSAIPFYQQLGFIVTSEPYEDAGIQHRDMIRQLSVSNSI